MSMPVTNLVEAEAWRQARLKADAFMPQARDAWTRFTDRRRRTHARTHSGQRHRPLIR